MTETISRRAALALAAGAALTTVAGNPAAAQTTRPAQPAAPDAPPVAPPPPPPPQLALVGAADDTAFNAGRSGIEQSVNDDGPATLKVALPKNKNGREQVRLVNDFVTKQKVNALIVSPINVPALGLICRRAIARGVKVVSYQSPLPAHGRNLHVEPAGLETMAVPLMHIALSGMADGGRIAILAGDRRNAQEKALIDGLVKEWVKTDYSRLKLTGTYYGNMYDDAAYKTVERLLDTEEGLKGFIATHPIALAAAARCVGDRGLAGKITVTGVGVPSKMQSAISSKVVTSFTANDPTDVGYAAGRLAMALLKKEIEPKQGATLAAGRLGTLTVGQGNVVTLSTPTTVDAASIDRLAAIY